ncbi:alpha-glucuronidase [Panacibacter ginsenosidivorans]|uniref:Xylan alpha-1,2-glucuronidase n=1 Tax=Panacibacter ginsenosidivorans TaxID=1813871 RepID=A0A5B8VFX5_9BACT|nr:alpha-glucuronidase family glycosyl hydrolase [Panacibacter ginsenosidivorans]QEC70043.1 alpha-glucuronidase [Panacibacter ginsenosidivorans]
MKRFFLFFITVILTGNIKAENGYELWLRYYKIDDAAILQQYRNNISSIQFTSSTPTLLAAKEELLNGLQGLLDKKITEQNLITNGCILVGTSSDPVIHSIISSNFFSKAGKEGYVIQTVTTNQKKVIVIAGNTEVGALYGCFAFLRLLQTHQNIQNLSIVSAPRIQLRMLDHWDNVNRTIERGYAGMSIWNWHKLPDYIDKRYKDYARANASIGINAVALNNVNANAIMLTKDYLIKVAALAEVFRPYGIKVYLSAKFSAPVEIGGLKTADPLDAQVQNWWKQKADEIYTYIPNFGGFLVKANSEEQPGPQTYNRTHADGANMLADALAPHGGIVIWRAFVYSNENTDDRFKQAYNEFKPFDGKFRNNVLIQVKNGPIDFQPREPFHPLFGAMPHTPLVMEFQLTQEYLGFSTHLVYLAPLFKECLDADTYEQGKNSTVSKVIDGSSEDHKLTGMAAVANIGSDIDWTGHPFAQANWYAFGRLAWDHELSAAQIADEWIRQTFTNIQHAVDTIKNIMLASREITVDYMTPLGLHHIMGYSHHYGPAPWYNAAQRADWNPVYYHKADSLGIGFDRTATGSNALAQYAPEARKQFQDLHTCDEKYLLWFHHVEWNYKMHSGRSLWDELCYKYYAGADSVKWMQQQWNSLKGFIDDERFEQVQMLLTIQQKEAVWWRNACVLYFQTFSRMPLPKGFEQPAKNLEYYESLQFPYAPGISGNQ